jgi:1-acyl-sn-glycerol-3-phosphate acyltransferase
MRIFIKFILKMLEKIIFRVKVLGEENIPKTGAALICGNHIHALDAALIVCMAKRQIYVLGKEELFKNPILKWLAKVFGVFPVKRDGSDIQAIKISLSLLKNNNLLLIFPEGTRNGIDKGVKLRNGAVTLAIKAKVPVIPVGVKGNFKIFRKVILNYGKPIYYDSHIKEGEQIAEKSNIENLTNELMEEILKLAK